MLKTAQVIRRFSFEEWGGTESVVWNVSQQLKANEDNNPIILSTTALSPTKNEVRCDITIKRFDYFYPYFPLSKKNIFDLDKKGGSPYSLAMLKELKTQDYDLIHVHSGGRCAQLAIDVAKKCGIPCVLTLHGGHSDVPQAEIEEMCSPFKNTLPYGNIIDRLIGWRKDIIDEADATICVGLNEYHRLKEQYPHKKIVHIPNGVDCKKFDNVTNDEIIAFKNKYKIPLDRELITCVSRIDYQKNQLLLVDVLKEINIKNGNKSHLLLVGPITSKDYYNKIISRIAELDLNAYVTIIAGLNNEDRELVISFKAADMFILPSLHEPFGIVLLEAWASGVGVLSTTAGGAGLLVENNQTGFLFNPENLDELIEQYDKMHNDLDFKNQIIKNATNSVSNYSWQKIAKDINQLYKDLITEKSH